MLARKDKVVKDLTDGVRHLFRKNRIEVFTGTARSARPQTVDVALNEGGRTEVQRRPHPAGHRIRAGQAAVSARSTARPSSIRPAPSASRGFPTTWSSSAPATSGSSWARSGSGSGPRSPSSSSCRASFPRPTPRWASCSKKSLVKQGLEFHLETKVTGASIEGERATVRAEKKDGSQHTFECERVLVAVGRRPLTEGLGLAEVGVSVDAKTGKVPVDAQFRTNVATISAIGDLIEGPMLAHKAEDEGIAFSELLAGKAGHVDYNTIPGVIYTWPELASVGLSEEQAKERGLNYRVGKFPFVANGRAKAMDETEGSVKILADAADRQGAGRAHPRRPRRGNDRRGGDRDGVRRQRRRHRPHLPRPPDNVRSHQRSRPGRRRPSDPHLSKHAVEQCAARDRPRLARC